jgi:hypothetical protein
MVDVRLDTLPQDQPWSRVHMQDLGLCRLGDHHANWSVGVGTGEHLHYVQQR